MNRRSFIASCGLIPLSGCAILVQNMTTEEKIAMAARLAKTAAFTGTSVYLNSNPGAGSLLAFHAAVAALDVMLGNTDASLEELEKILKSLPEGKLGGMDSEVYWLAGVQVIDLAAVGFNVRSSAAVVAIATAIRDGIALAIDPLPLAKAKPSQPARPATPEKPPKIRMIRI